MHLTSLLTLAAMIAFAANSLLARMALGSGSIDAGSYTTIRMVAGAVFLFALVRPSLSAKGGGRLPGTWPAAAALFTYALAFSLAYLLLGAATGALILFAAVQATMLAWSIFSGVRPNRLELIGLAVALSGFIYLLLPGVGTPDPLGSLLMIAAGGAWGIYSLLGRGSRNPLQETAGNFVRSVAFCVPVAAVAAVDGHVSLSGAALAATSGAVASGLGYAVWYRALPKLRTITAAVVQLSVPVIAAAGAIALLDEALTLRFVAAAVLTLGGIAVAVLARARQK